MFDWIPSFPLFFPRFCHSIFLYSLLTNHMRRFLRFYEALVQSTSSVEALAEERSEPLALALGDGDGDGPWWWPWNSWIHELKEETKVQKLLEEKWEGAMAWIDAALSADLDSSCCLMGDERRFRLVVVSEPLPPFASNGLHDNDSSARTTYLSNLNAEVMF